MHVDLGHGGHSEWLVRVQDLAMDLKGEVRELLAAKGITKFVIKPVKRRYAFDVPGVPHRDQWVLKVRYDAALPMLEMGLKGNTLRLARGRCLAHKPPAQIEKGAELDLEYNAVADDADVDADFDIRPLNRAGGDPLVTGQGENGSKPA